MLRDLVSKKQDAWHLKNDTGGCPLAPTCTSTHLHAHTCVHTHACTFTHPCAPTYAHSQTKADKPNSILNWRGGSVAVFWDKKKNGRKNTSFPELLSAGRRQPRVWTGSDNRRRRGARQGELLGPATMKTESGKEPAQACGCPRLRSKGLLHSSDR